MKFFSVNHLEVILFTALIVITVFGDMLYGTQIGITLICYGACLANARCKELANKLDKLMKDNHV